MTITATQTTLATRPWLRQVAIVVAAVLVTAVTSVVVLAIDGSFEAPAPGLPDPGPLVRHGLPVLRAAYDITACLTIGLLVLTTFVLSPERGTDPKELQGVRARAVRTAAVAATAWLASGVALLVFTYADVAGSRLGASGFASQLNFYVREIDLGRTAFIGLLFVLLVATCAGGVTRIYPTGWLTGFALLALFPIALSGHASGTDDHQNAVDSIAVHLLGVTIWVGGLLALVVLGPKLGKGLAVAARRYSVLAFWCFAAVAASGVINAWLRVGSLDNLASEYGVLVIVKTALLVVLGGFGWWQRTRLLGRLDTATADGTSARGTFARLALLEVMVMAFTIGIAVALSRTPTPIPQDSVIGGDPVKAILGYPMPADQSVGLLLTSWYPDYLWLGIAAVMAGCYLTGVLRMRRRGDAWAPGRTAAWLAGCAFLVFATSGGPAVYARVNFSGHMVQHMTLMMLVPIFLVLGAPITLALRTLRKRDDESMGPREWLLAALHSRFVRVVSNPIVAAVLFVGSLVGFYYTGLFQLSLATHTGHILMTVHFLLVGYLFVWVLIGVDPGPPHPPYPLRLLLLLATISFHAFFGLALMTGDTILAPDWWPSINKTDAAALVTDQHLGGGIAWGVGELPTLILVLILGIMWARDDDREAKRLDRKADRDGDAELNAWNDQLSRLADREER